MKMIPGTGTIYDYSSFTSNCRLRQRKYRIPVNSLSDVQLYIDIGLEKPTTVLIELLHTCDGAEESITLVSGAYVIGQDKNDRWYGVFKELTGGPVTGCFVIAITLDDDIYFSEEYCIEPPCNALTLLKACYGKLDPLASTDCEGRYFGVHAGTGAALGDTSVTYSHQLLIREAEVSLAAIKNTFKQGRTRTFRSEKEKIYQFFAEFVPEWYISEIDAIFYRGEVYIDGEKYLLSETQFEKIDDCSRLWKPAVALKESCMQSFSCSDDQCTPAPEECCDPLGPYAIVEFVNEESGGSGGITPPPLEDEEPGETPVIPGITSTIVVECVVDSAPVVTGTTEPVTGITDGSTVISCADFADRRVYIERGHIMIPSFDPGDGTPYYTKVLADDFITLSTPLVNGEFIYIETIL